MNRIKEIRELRNISQKELAKKINRAPQTLSGWENNIHDPDLESLKIIARILNTTIDELLNNSNENNITISKEQYSKLIQIKNLIIEIENLNKKIN